MLNNIMGCVVAVLISGNAWGASLLDNGDGTVTDFDTGLIWQQADDNNARNWDAANTYCSSLSLADNANWRLPKRKALQSIVDYRISAPAIDKRKFPNTDASYYWSASSNASFGAFAWRVDFYDGDVNAYFKTDSYYVRCVR